MSEYIITVPDDGRHYEIYTPVEDGVHEVVRCRDCRKSYKADEMFFCKMFSAMVEPWRFCSWGEKRGDESLAEFIEREGRKKERY